MPTSSYIFLSILGEKSERDGADEVVIDAEQLFPQVPRKYAPRTAFKSEQKHGPGYARKDVRIYAPPKNARP